MSADPILTKMDQGKPVEVSLLSESFGKVLSKVTEQGLVRLDSDTVDYREYGEELHKGSMKNIESAVNQEIRKHPGKSFYIVRALRRDMQQWTVFHEVIQSRPMCAPVPQTPGMTLFHFDHKAGELRLLWSIPHSMVLQAKSALSKK